MRPRRRTMTVAGAVLIAASLLLGPTAGAGTAPSGQNRVRIIKRQTRTVLRRTESVSGDVRTAETPEKVEVTLAADVLFGFDQAALTPAAGATIDDLAARLKNDGKNPVSIVGYTDSKGTGEYNLDLSRRRAAAVRDVLALKAPGFTYAVDGKGAADPVAPNEKEDGSDNPDGRARNRRVTITFARKG